MDGKFYSIPVAGGAAVNIPFTMETELLLGLAWISNIPSKMIRI